MKLLPIRAAIAATVFATVPAFANPELLVKKHCLACHSVDSSVPVCTEIAKLWVNCRLAKTIGPNYKDVASKYAGQSQAVERLTEKVLKGGSGSWGVIPMPANPQISEAEAKQLVTWILSLK